MPSTSISTRGHGIRALVLVFSFATTASFAQQPGNKSTDKSKTATDSHSLNNQNVLREMNNALQELAARVSPAVVQIQTTGYGPLTDRDSDRGKTALIVRQH